MTKTRLLPTMALSLLLSVSLMGQDASIPEASIAPLKQEFAALAESRRSISSRRRTLKKVIRTAEALIKAQPKAANRFEVLAVILNAQLHLLQMEKTDRNRDEFFETCEALAKAPEAYSDHRLTAELFLSDRELSAKNADAKERIKALESMVARYRNTSAELECLMKAIRLAPQLGGHELKSDLLKSLSRRFAGDATAINFQREIIGSADMDVLFSGTFERLEGPPIVFPHDRLGHSYFVVFWSKESPEAISRLKQLKMEEEKLPGVVEVYSLNLDELPDGGKSVLDSIGLKCTVLRLPGGQRSEVFRTYAVRQPAAIRVNQLGHASLPPINPGSETDKKEAAPAKEQAHGSEELDEFSYPENDLYMTGIKEFDRYAVQLRYLFIGDFLLASETLPSNGQANAVQACFVRPPMRYRLSKAEELANYTKASELSAQAIAASKSTRVDWRLHNYQIIALMGMANISGSIHYLKQAVKEARKILGLSPPQGSDISARYCLAMAALRNRPFDRKAIIEGFLADCGGKNAGPTAHGAACILAMAADSQEHYQRYRNAFLTHKEPSPGLAALSSFLRDRYHQYYLFKASPNFKAYNRFYRFVEERHLNDNNLHPMRDPLPPFEVKTLDDKTFSLPIANSDKLTVLVFVEPPAGGDELPSQFYSPAPKPSRKLPNPQPGGELGAALGIANAHVNKGVRVVSIFLSDDVERVRSIQKRHSLSETVAMLPGGLSNPIVNQLGILSADRFANVMLLRRDGTIAWRKHGLVYQQIGTRRHNVATNGLRFHIIACDAEAGYRALKAKDYEHSLKLFTRCLDRGLEGCHKWNSSLAHGRALSHLALKDYDSAFKEIENAITIHLEVSGGRWPKPHQFNHDPDKPCSSMIHMLTTKAKVLDHLGRASEARAARNKIAKGPTDYPTHYSRVMGFDRPYEAFEDRLSVLAKEIK